MPLPGASLNPQTTPGEPMLEFILARYNYWIVIVLMMAGLYIVFSRGNLVKTIVGLNIFQTSVFIFYITIGKVVGGTAPILVGKPGGDYGGDHHGEGHGDDGHHGEEAHGDGHALQDAAADHGHEGGQLTAEEAAAYVSGERANTLSAGDGGAAPDTTESASLHTMPEISGGNSLYADGSGAPVNDPALDRAADTATAADHVSHAADGAHGAADAAHGGYEVGGAASDILYSNPLPHVLILTAIVVGVATTSVGLAIAVRIREAYGTIEEDALEEMDNAAEYGQLSTRGGEAS